MPVRDVIQNGRIKTQIQKNQKNLDISCEMILDLQPQQFETMIITNNIWWWNATYSKK